MKKKDRILILAPHTDDGEFGCGGSINKFINEGKNVYYAAFSTAEQSIPEGFPSDATRREVKSATTKLGLKRSNLILFGYEVRKFSFYRQQILDTMIKLNNDIRPELVFLPSTEDTHQDHKVVVEEGFRAFKKISMLGYEIPWNNLSFKTNAFVFITKSNLEKKINALKCYISQLNKAYVTDDFIKSLAHTRGVQIGTKYAEAFEVIRWVIN